MVHPTLVVESPGVTIGAGTRLHRDIVVRGPGVAIGNGVFVNDGCYFTSSVVLEDNVSVGQYSRFITGHHPAGTSDRRAGVTERRPILVGRGSWIGASVTVLPGVTIGAGCVIAAGAVVTKDCLPHSLYAGVPAVWKKHLDVD